MSRPIGTQAVRFLGVGLANTVVDMAAFALLVHLTGRPLLSNVLAWSVAVLFSYVVNGLVTFDRVAGRSRSGSFLRFVSLGALISLGVSQLSLVVLTDLIGLWPAKILGVATAAVLNFFAARWSIEGRLLR